MMLLHWGEHTVNANELADYLEDITDWEESPYRQAATMLRQQQAEIEALKAKLAYMFEQEIKSARINR